MTICKPLFAVAIAAALTSPALSQVEEVRLKIDGVTCPSCIVNVEKSVQKLKGVDTGAKVQSFLNSGITVIPWSAFQAFDPEKVRDSVKDSGFTLRAINLTAVGALPDMPSVGATTIDLKAGVTGEVFHLAKMDRADHQQSWNELLAYLDDSSNDRSVRVEGLVSDGASASSKDWTLEVTGWAPTEFGAEVFLTVEGFNCEKCAARTMRSFGAFDDVIHLEADHENGLVHVWTKSRKPDLDKLCDRIAELGFQCTEAHSHKKGDDAHDMDKKLGMSGLSGK
jgi:copper chaperone CopZ